MAVTESKGATSASGSGNSLNRNGRPPTTSVLRSAMYYQNRIIVPEKARSPIKTGSSGSGNAINNTSGNITSGNTTNTPIAQNSGYSLMTNANNPPRTASANSSVNATNTTRENFVLDSEDVMDSRNIDIVVTDTESGTHSHRVKKKSVWKRIARILQDNRMRGKANAEFILAGSNAEDFRLLKKVLNIIFLTIGIALLIAVISVIIYTTIDSS